MDPGALIMARSWNVPEGHGKAYEYPIPNQPAFTVAEVAVITRKARTTVWYWINNGKLISKQNTKGDPYILKAELQRFIQEYLCGPPS